MAIVVLHRGGATRPLLFLGQYIIFNSSFIFSNNNLEQYLKLLFHSWFEEYEPFQDLKFNDSLIGKIPTDWEYTIISKLIEVKDGTHDSPKSVLEGHPLVTSKHLLNYGIKFDDLDSLKTKIEEYINFYNNFRLQSKLKGMAPLEYRHHSSCNYIYF